MKNLETRHRYSPEFAKRRSFAQRVPFVLLAFLFFIGSFAHGAEITVNAELSADSTTTDQPVRLSVTVEGGMNATIPDEINSDGLTIQYAGQQRRMEINNFRGTVSVITTYTVSADRPGKYTIQPIEIQAGGKTFKTEALHLTVTQGSGGGRSSNNNNDEESGSNQNKIFSELIIPKDTAYVGEIIPAEIRYYFQRDVQFQVNPPGQVPQIAGEGFSKQRYPQPRLEQTEIKGRPYRVLIYKTAVVAAKSGDLTVGPAELDVVVSIPQNRRRRPSLNDPFSDDFFSNNPFFSPPIQREMNLRTEPVTLKIKALPPGKPPGFNGAVGQFTLQTSAKPVNVKSGDPVTLTSVVSGRGNFDVVSAPTLSDTKDWRTYPPSGRLSSSDEMGVTGDKIFDMAIVPEGKATQIPSVHFSYFDPQTGKYVTLTSEPIAVQVEGTGSPAAIPEVSPRVSPAPAVAATPAPTSSPTPANDILPIRTQWRETAQTFAPVWQQPVFWVAQGIPLLVLLALAMPKILAATRPDATTLRQRGWKSEHAGLAAKLASDRPEDFFPAAARSLELQSALKRGADSATPEEVLATLGFEGEEAETAREIFRRRDEIGYGGIRGGREISVELRKRYESILK